MIYISVSIINVSAIGIGPLNTEAIKTHPIQFENPAVGDFATSLIIMCTSNTQTKTPQSNETFKIMK